MLSRRAALARLAGTSGALGSASLLAQDDRTPIKLLVGASAGTDFTARFNVFPHPASPQELGAILQAEHKQFAGLVKASGYVPE